MKTVVGALKGKNLFGNKRGRTRSYTPPPLILTENVFFLTRASSPVISSFGNVSISNFPKMHAHSRGIRETIVFIDRFRHGPTCEVTERRFRSRNIISALVLRFFVAKTIVGRFIALSYDRISIKKKKTDRFYHPRRRKLSE